MLLEPRHASWFTPAADALLQRHGIARVAADPPRAPGGDEPGGWRGFAYYRLHGSPRMYYSAYESGFLDALAQRISSHQSPAWCVFDNTAGNAAVPNALDLRERLETAARASRIMAPPRPR